jgi:hypothetical protein
MVETCQGYVNCFCLIGMYIIVMFGGLFILLCNAVPVSWSLTATNAQDQVTSERGGPSPYRAVEPW